MNFKEIIKKAGSFWSYGLFFFILLAWYFLDNVYISNTSTAQGNSLPPFLVFLIRFLFSPLISAGVFGGIHLMQEDHEISSFDGFFTGVRKNYWRLLGSSFLYLIVYYLVSILVALITGSLDQEPSRQSALLNAGISIPFATISLLWYSAIVVERKIFKGLMNTFKILINPSALTIGLIWGVVSAADTYFFDLPGFQASLAVNGIRAVVLAAVKIVVIAASLALYKLKFKAGPDEAANETAIPGSQPSRDNGLINASFGFGILSFIPLVNLVALVLGIMALKRRKAFALRPAIAVCLGGFFAIFYGMLVAGWFMGGTDRIGSPGYAFLSQANAELGPQVKLVEQGSYQEIRQQLESMDKDPDRSWTIDCLSALVKTHTSDSKGALEDFRTAAGKEPERSEFYYYYGLALLNDGQTDLAEKQFQIALTHEPKLAVAERYVNLIDTAYDPPRVVSVLITVIVLLFLFSLHEYGHAYAAWKAGDDTAKNEGRLTLNPIKHLDLFGSILLPGILLWQQSGVVFGWAKPVPVNPANFRNPRKDGMRVSFAGPGVNFLISMVCFLILGLIIIVMRLLWPETLSLDIATPFSSVSIIGPPFARALTSVVIVIKELFYTSLALGIFNLIPVPPLDGSWILSGILPQRLRDIFEKTRLLGNAIFLLLVVTHILSKIMSVPISAAWLGFQVLAMVLGFG